MSSNTTAAQDALATEAAIEVALRDEEGAELESALVLMERAACELLLLVDQMERPTPQGFERHRVLAIALAADLRRRRIADGEQGREP